MSRISRTYRRQLPIPRPSRRAIATVLAPTSRAIAKHTSTIFAKLNLQPSDDDNRRVLAVLAYLGR